MMLNVKLAASQVLSLWRAGALRVLVFALVLAVVAISAVGFFTQRVETALNQQGALLLGADLAVLADHPINAKFKKDAEALGIATVNTYEFASMVVYGDSNQLAEIKAVGQGFPLRGDLTIGQQTDVSGVAVKSIPRPGEIWLEPRLANLLNAKVGDMLSVGERKLLIAAILLREPSRGGDMFGFAPRLMMNAVDLPSTQLIQYGSRVKYQLLLAGSPKQVKQFYTNTEPRLVRGEKIQDVRNARPEIKLALDKSQQFLGLSSMVSVILAMVAMLLASLPYIKQSLDSFALMRCFGASKSTVLQVLVLQTLLIALASAFIGVVIGFVLQFGLATLAGRLFVEVLPPVPMAPAIIATMASIVMMVAVVLPHAWQMRHLSALNILRRDTLVQPISNQAKFIPAAAVMSAMVFWQAHDAKLALSMIAGLFGLVFVVLLFAYAIVRGLNGVLALSPSMGGFNDVKLGLLGLKRRFALSTLQMMGFSMGLMVLMLLALIRGDLLHNWQASLPPDAPNRFVINIQAAQIAGVRDFFAQQQIKDAAIFPMVRGRLISQNGQILHPEQWQDDRAKRLAEREFNLSWAAQMQSDNKLVAGRWWTVQEYGKPSLSLEQDLAKTLGIKLGDKLAFDVAGSPLTLTVTSLRKVDWDTMRANFFAVTPPGVLDAYAANYISSFHLPLGADKPLNGLIRAYPNLTVIDIAALMQQVRGIMQKMSLTIEYVFVFSLLAGMAVLYAALVATREERITEATLLRVFGASRKQVGMTYVVEFACIGFVAALTATVAANVLAYYLSERVLDIPFHLNIALALATLLLATLMIPCAAWIGLRGFLNMPARKLLNSI